MQRRPWPRTATSTIRFGLVRIPVNLHSFDDAQAMQPAQDDAESSLTCPEDIHLIRFVHLASVPSLYYNRLYCTSPPLKDAAKGFSLLRLSMCLENRCAVAQGLLGGKQTMFILIPTDESFVLASLHPEEVVREAREVFPSLPQPDVSDMELLMARQLIQSMNGTFKPESYPSPLQPDNRPDAGSTVRKARATVTNLAEALKASVEAARDETLRPEARSGLTGASVTAARRAGAAGA